MNERYNNTEIVTGIRERNRDVLCFVYEKHKPEIVKYLMANDCDKDKAKDIFQEAMYNVYREIKYKDLIINESFFGYLLVTCKRIFIIRNNRNKKVIIQNQEFYTLNAIDNAFLDSYKECWKYKLYQEQLIKLGGSCRKIIQLVLKGHFFHEIIVIMGYKNEEVARSKHANCKSTLKRMIKSTTEYRENI